MNKSFKAMVAVGAVALTAGQASATTVPAANPAAAKVVNAKFKSSLIKPAGQVASLVSANDVSNKEWQGE